MVNSLAKKGLSAEWELHQRQLSNQCLQSAGALRTFHHVLVCSLSRDLLFHMQTLSTGQWKTFLLFRVVPVLAFASQLFSAMIILQPFVLF